MAITTLDGALAGMRAPENLLKVGATMEAVGVHHSFMYTSGRPGAGAAGGQGLGGAALTSKTGQIPWTNPGAGNSYLARFEAAASTVGTLLLLDRLWENDTIAETTTTGQTINSAAFPARDSAGSTNGAGIMVAIEVSTATTNAGAITNTTLTYTNQAGTGSRTATMGSFPATAVAGTFVQFQLAAGDTGVRSIQTLTLGTSYGGGAIHLVAYRVLAILGLSLINTSVAVDALTGGFVRCFDNTVPFLVWLPSVTTATTVNGQLIVTQG